MISWPIAAALDSGLFDRVVVSTDDDEIANAALSAGAEVPFRRPVELADDHTPTRAVVNHALDTLSSQQNAPIKTVCLIYPTAAFLAPTDLAAARAQLDVAGRDFIFSAQAYPHPVQRALVHDGAGGVRMLMPAESGTRTQDLPETFHDAALFYWGHASAFLARKPMYGPTSEPYFVSRLRAVDIDTPADWEIAERLMHLRLADGTSAL